MVGRIRRVAGSVLVWMNGGRAVQMGGWGRAGRLSALTGLTRRQVIRRLYSRTERWAEIRIGDQPVKLRPGTSDVAVLDETFCGGYHRSLWTLPEHAVVLDLGSNIGLTMLDYHLRHPAARVAGVELDDANAAIARANGADVLTAAIVDAPGPVTYSAPAGDGIAFAVGPGPKSSPGVTIDQAIAHFGFDWIDLMKVDIEGAEAAVFDVGGDWPERVGRILVETHPPYSVEECIDALDRLGFSAWRDDRHWAAVAAVSKSLADESAL
jgi:FkbM family methyltransferase